LVPVAHWSGAHPVISLSLPMIALSTMSTGDMVVTSGSLCPVVPSVPGVPDVGGVWQGSTSIEVVGTDPRLGNDTKSLLRNLMVHGAGAGVPGALPQVMRPQPPGPRVSWVWGYLDCF
jgi:hypothetical protein